MSFARRLVTAALSLATEDALAKLSDEIAPTMTVETKHGPIRFKCRSEKAAWRARGALTKELGTIQWLDSLGPGTLWDVGANIGVYSVYAARKGLSVCAFEPQPLNYASLVENAALAGNIRAFPVGFGARTEVADIRTDHLRAGMADIGITHRGQLAIPTLIYRIDDFVREFGIPAPDYIKLDVDGVELDVLRGAQETLRGVREAQVEVDIATADEHIALLAGPGLHPYTFSVKGEDLHNSAETGEMQVTDRRLSEMLFQDRGRSFAVNVRFHRA